MNISDNFENIKRTKRLSVSLGVLSTVVFLNTSSAVFGHSSGWHGDAWGDKFSSSASAERSACAKAQNDATKTCRQQGGRIEVHGKCEIRGSDHRRTSNGVAIYQYVATFHSQCR